MAAKDLDRELLDWLSKNNFASYAGGLAKNNIYTLDDLRNTQDIEQLMASIKMHKIFRKKFETAFNESFGGGGTAVPSQISVASPKPFSPKPNYTPKFKITPKTKPKPRSISIHSKSPQSPYSGMSPHQIWKMKKMEKDKMKNAQKDKIQSPIQQNVNKENEEKQKEEEERKRIERVEKQKQIELQQKQKQEQEERERLLQQKRIAEEEQKKAEMQRLAQQQKQQQIEEEKRKQSELENAERERLKAQKIEQEAAENLRIQKLKEEEEAILNAKRLMEQEKMELLKMKKEHEEMLAMQKKQQEQIEQQRLAQEQQQIEENKRIQKEREDAERERLRLQQLKMEMDAQKEELEREQQRLEEKQSVLYPQTPSDVNVEQNNNIIEDDNDAFPPLDTGIDLDTNKSLQISDLIAANFGESSSGEQSMSEATSIYSVDMSIVSSAHSVDHDYNNVDMESSVSKVYKYYVFLFRIVSDNILHT